MREALSSVLILGGLVLLVLGIVAVVRGHLDWMRITRRRTAAWVTAGAFAVMLVGGGVAPPSPEVEPAADTDTIAAATADPTTQAPPTAAASSTTQTPLAAPAAAGAADNPDAATAARSALDILPVKGRAPKTGYDRDLFGQAWTDDVTVEAGHNGCDTRNDILRRDLRAITLRSGSNGCTVETGTLDDAYTATSIAFTRGQSTSAAVQIDHVVALSDAWQKGAQQLDEQTRRNFANDPRNLQAVDGPTNQQKSDGDAATWLPPNKAYRCTYVARQIEVKAVYGLWVTQAEKDAMARVLESCGAPAAAEEPVTQPQQVQTPATTAVPAPAPVTTPAPAPAPATEPATAPSAVYYRNCDAARAAGAAPIRVGQPGYSSKLDRDGDGVACE